VVLVGALRVLSRKRRERPGSVADLVRRGQLKSDRRGMYDFYPYSLIVTLFCFHTFIIRYFNLSI